MVYACTSLASGCSREDPEPSLPRCNVCPPERAATRSSASSSKVVGRELALVDAVGSALNLELALAGSALNLDSALAILVLGTGDVRLGRSAQLSRHIKNADGTGRLECERAPNERATLAATAPWQRARPSPSHGIRVVMTAAHSTVTRSIGVYSRVVSRVTVSAILKGIF